MEIIYQFNLKEGKTGEYVEFVAKNEQKLKELSPEGWTYLGTFFTVQALGEYDVQQRWDIADYDSLGKSWGFDETYDRLIVEGISYIKDAEVRATVVKSADEVKTLSGT